MAIHHQEGLSSVMNTKRTTALVLAIAIFGDSAAALAQAAQTVPSPAASTAPAPIGAVPASLNEASVVRLSAGRSTIVDVGVPIARVSLTSADVADALVTTPNQLLVNAKSPGTISMFVWDRAGTLRRYEVTVGRDLGPLNDQIRQLFPGERVEVQSTGKNLVISGNVSSKDIAEKVANVASGHVEKKEEVVSLLQVRQGPAANQVLLRVRFAEVSRSAMTDLGATLYGDGAKNLIGRSTTGQFGQPAVFDQRVPMVGDTQVFSDFLNLFLFSYKHQVGAVIKALQTRGLFQSLAEPNLVAESGKEASFLAGGEIPVPVVQGGGGNIAVSVVWKEFGVRLSFTPTVNGNNVRLKVKPEVSTLDFGNAITLQGFRIPALSTRRTETELELENGQTFAIAGLMNNSVATTMRKIPGIGDIPVLGALFQSKAAQKDQTELVVMITPEILRMGSSGVTSDLPRAPEKFMEPTPEKKTQPMPAPAFTAARAAGRSAAAVPPAPTPVPPSLAFVPSRSTSAKSPAEAAATVAALTPHTLPVTHAPVPEPVAPPVAADVLAATVLVEPQPSGVIAHADLPFVAVEPMPVVPATEADAFQGAAPDQAPTVQTDKSSAKHRAREERERAKASKKVEELRAKEQARAEKQAVELAKQHAKRDAEAAKKQRELEKKVAAASPAHARG